MGSAESTALNADGPDLREPKEICLKPSFRPDFSKIAAAGQVADDQLVHVHVLDPSSGRRLVVDNATGEKLVLEPFFAQVSSLLGRQIAHVHVKHGMPERGSFASSHPGWDERIRSGYAIDSTSISLSCYRVGDDLVADVVVDEELVPSFKNYPYF